MNLQERFYLMLKTLNFSENDQDILWNDLNKHYSQKFKKYHNTEHLSQMFSQYDLHKNEIENPVEIEIAIFYHDIIYSISSKENEEKSAEFALEIFKNSKVNLEIIRSLILATKHHIAISNDEMWMVDFDLSILGHEKEVYLEYVKKIRKEYRIYPNLIYNPGRKKVLHHFLDKNRIFQTETFYELYEETARKNLETELNSL